MYSSLSALTHPGSGNLRTAVPRGLHFNSRYEGFKCFASWSVLCVHTITSILPKHTFRLGAIIGQLSVGLVCDRIGRKNALVFTTLIIIMGATLGTAAHGAHGSAKGLFWFMTFARGLTGIVRAGDIECVLDLIRLQLGCRW